MAQQVTPALGELTVINLGFYAVMSVLAVYLVQQLDFSAMHVALALGCNSFGLRFSRLLASPVIGRMNPKQAICIALCLAAGGYFGLWLSTSPLAVCLALFIAGTGYGCNGLVVTTLMAHTRRAQSRSLSNYAMMSTLSNIAAAIGPLIARMFVGGGHYSMIFLFAGVAACISLAISLFALGNLPRHASDIRWRQSLREPFADGRYARVLLMVLLGWALYTQKYASFTLFVSDELQAERFIGYYLFMYAAVIIALSIPLSRYFNWQAIATQHIIGLSFLCYTVGFLWLWFMPSLSGAGISIIVWAAGEAMLIPSLNSITAETVSPANRVTAFSLNAVAIGLGEAGGNIAGIHLYEMFAGAGNASGTFGAFALLGFLSILLIHTLARTYRYAAA